MPTFLYREGDGNEGNFPRYYVTLTDTECPYAAVVALMANRYIPGTKTRSHIMRNASTDGETEYGVSGMVCEGPKGEEAFGAAWLTAELKPATDADIERSCNLDHYATLRDALDIGAWRFYLKTSRKG